MLASIYLHYVLDEWFEHEVKPRLRGQAAEIRYADDFMLCFQYREDAERVLAVLTKRFAKYGLTLHPEKTRLLAFGRSALPRHPHAPKPATFDFLGFTHVCARSRRGRFAIHVRTRRQRLQRSVKAVAQWCQQHRHDPVEDQAVALNARLRGHYQYYGRPTNYRWFVAVLSARPAALAQVAHSANAREAAAMARLRAPVGPPPAASSAYLSRLGESGEPCMKNRVR